MDQKRRDLAAPSLLPETASAVAWQALRESRLRGLPAVEEYRIIADRLYRNGFRDLPPNALLAWIEEAVAAEYEQLLRLRQFGDRLHALLADDDLAGAAWLLACELPPEARERLIHGVERLNALERDPV